MSTGIVVRPAREEDTPALVALAGEGLPLASADARARMIERALADGLHELLVAKASEEIVGFIEWLLAYDVAEGAPIAYVLALYVRPDWRQKGVGTALFKAVMSRAKARGASEIHASVVAENEAAVRLYRRCGFTRVYLLLEAQLDQ